MEPGSTPRIRTRRSLCGIPEPHFVNLPPFGAVLGLVVRARRILRARHARLAAEELGDARRGDLEVFAVIGDVDARAAGNERAPHLREHFRADDASLLLALARPR